MKMYELTPTNGRKSFHHKALVQIDDDGTETLISYTTPIMHRYKDGRIVRLWDGWGVTTGTHIAAFCGMKKAEFLALPLDVK